ncbi:lysozyme inhibitor LprI family protein [Roseibium sediminicola]|uniref:Lysozyme inhibitor LprI family protein n=1 Tax=Roseibium sediminicola TaxID=2933272 RepID=A0ABT0GYZ4_9HYPH|nr:lysozyme inhibitor LprI family protein [Roseibium sp. CAU 1639]MCK7614460.1 lysozyme inhibitor LprI family protein [Roseibium sp. CAU 1639]
MAKVKAVQAAAAVFLATLATGTAQAQAQEIADCSNAMSQSEMTQCAHDDWQKADAELNALYKKAMAKMREADDYLPDYLKGAADTLRDAQRAWIPYRDKACESYGFMARGGTMEPMLVYGCQADLTNQRIKELKDLVEGLGN